MRCVRSVVPALALTAAAVLFAPPARAQAAVAEQLFIDGQKLMDAGKYPEACAKFADSQRLDPGLGTLIHLAVCHEKEGKSATAWSEFTDAAAQAHRANQPDREKFAKEHAAALEGKLQKVIIEMPHAPPGTSIKLDGAALPSGVLGTELPLDPGDHALEVSAPGKKTWRQARLSLGPSAVVTRVQVTLEDDTPGVPAPTSAVPAATPGGPTAPPGADAAGGDDSTRRLIAYGLGAAGIVSLGVAVGEQVTSIGRNNDTSKYPSGSPERQTVSDQGSQAQTYAIVFGAAGLAAVGTGVYLLLTSHSSAPATTGRAVVTPLLGPQVAGAALRLAW